MPWNLLSALLVMALLGLALRMVLGGGRRGRRKYGLLCEVATASSQHAAAVVTSRLHEYGIRATTVPAEDGSGLQIMVFPSDEQRAVTLLLEDGWPPPEDEDATVPDP